MGVLTIDSIQDVAVEEATVETPSTEESTTTEAITTEATEATEATATEEQETEEEVSSLEAVPVEPVTEGDLNILSELEDLIQEGANESDSGEMSSSAGCASNVYVGQQQEDGSWKTVCKE